MLYDVTRTQLSISNAQKIESESWDTTRELVGDFEEASARELPTVAEIESVIDENEETDATSLLSSLGEYGDAVLALVKGDIGALSALSRSQGRPIEAIVDTINEISACAIGDILIEETDDGYSVIADYLELIN